VGNLGQQHIAGHAAADPGQHARLVNSVVSLKDLSSSIWVWFKEGKNWAIRDFPMTSQPIFRPGEGIPP
jgi:hypothetical protein